MSDDLTPEQWQTYRDGLDKNGAIPMDPRFCPWHKTKADCRDFDAAARGDHPEGDPLARWFGRGAAEGMRVTAEAWAEQVARADNAEMREASAYIGVAQVLREHDECLCRHCRRILGNVLKARELTPLWRTLDVGEQTK